ncbi:unnamed protein product [Ambrosiozyma monospora]|uniref:Unnamed protein product n=1 Tax=Ambrosiozyma monospora TaxID=43982 RepID=A0ACB5T3L0_AMBMO|nr:unnamed protein product [Ambrosiozyma monospora]
MEMKRNINASPSPSVSEIYSRLANCCDSVIIDNEYEYPKNVEWINNISSLEDLTAYCQSKLCLKNAHLLKKFRLTVDSLDASLFDTISTTLQSIDLEVDMSYDIPSIRLPLSLRELTVYAREVPKIINVKELTNLSEAIIYFLDKPLSKSSEPWPPYDIFEAVQSSIDKLPSSVTKLDLRMAPFCQEPRKQLSLTNLPQLEDLTLQSDRLDHSESSLPLKNLHVPAFAINERLPNTLKSLKIGFEESGAYDIPYVFRNFILPLENLTELSISMDYVGVDDDDAGALNQCVLSSSICSSLRILTIQAYESVYLSNFWKSFCPPLQGLSGMDLSIGNDSHLLINEWPPDLNILRMDFRGNDEDSHAELGVSRVELHEIPKSSLKRIILSGNGNITLKCGPDGETETIILSYDEEDGVELTKSLERYADDSYIEQMFESIEYVKNIKFEVDGNWGLYK